MTGGLIQSIQRVIGRRVAPPSGRFPSAAIRAAMDANLVYRTRVPKGIFIYLNHEEMTRDRDARGDARQAE